MFQKELTARMDLPVAAALAICLASVVALISAVVRASTVSFRTPVPMPKASTLSAQKY